MNKDESESTQTFLTTVFAKEAEWKNLLLTEIRKLSSELTDSKQEAITLRSQLDELKEAFAHNLLILKERDKSLLELNSLTVNLKKDLHDRDIHISEVKASLDRCQAQLGVSKKIEQELQNELDAQRAKSIHREEDLRYQHKLEMETFRQSEASERSKFQTTITRLKADMETEKIRFASDLDETMSKLKKEAEEQALQASQRQFELELRVRLYEDMYNRVAENMNALHKQVEDKDKQIAELETTVASTRNEVELLQNKIHEKQTALDMEEQRLAAVETARSRLEADSKSEKQRLIDQLEEMRSQLDWHKKELQTATLVREEAATAASLENQQLLEALSKERKETQKMSSLLEEAQAARQLAERKARVARSEAKRLEKDLKSALLSNPVPSEAPRNCDNQHLLEQLERLQDTCDKLETENVGLRRSINVMSTQAHLVAEHSEKMRKNPGTASDKETQTAPLRYNSELSHKLRAAVEVIRRLAEEKRILIELSNRHQAQIRQLTSQPNALGQSKQSPKDLVSSRTTYSGPLLLAPGNRKFWPSAPYTTCETEDSGSSIPGKESVTAIYNMLDETVSHLDGLPNRLITTKLL